MTPADILAKFLCDQEIAAKSYGEEAGYFSNTIDIYWRNGTRNHQIELRVQPGLKVKCDSMYHGMAKSVTERATKKAVTAASVDMADPGSFEKILRAVRDCTTGNCTECVFTK